MQTAHFPLRMHFLVYFFKYVIFLISFYSKCPDKANFSLDQEDVPGRRNSQTGRALALIAHFLKSAFIDLMR